MAREAGVSRGLLHYYFGSKEQLLVEVVRHDCGRAQPQHGRADREGATAPTRSSRRSCVGLEEFLEDDAGGQAVIYEMLSASRHSEEIRAELAELYRQWRERLAGWLRTKEREGVIRLQADPEAVASILFSLGDGFGIQVLSDPELGPQAAFELGVATARRLLGAEPSPASHSPWPRPARDRCEAVVAPRRRPRGSRPGPMASRSGRLAILHDGTAPRPRRAPAGGWREAPCRAPAAAAEGEASTAAAP